MNVRETYEAFIKGGGFYVAKLLCGRTPALYDKGESFEIPMEYMLVLHVENDANESVEDMIASYSEQFSIGRNIKALYYAIKDMCEYLTEVDMGAVPHKYQHIYPELILKTYGEGLDNITDANLTVENSSGRLSHVRKTALNLLLDLISQNDYFGIIDYDFKSNEALETINEIMQNISLAKQNYVLKQTQKTFMRMLRGDTAKEISENLRALLRAIDLNVNIGQEIDTQSQIKQLDDERCLIENRNFALTSKYKLYIDGVHVATSKIPRFTVDAKRIAEGSVIRIVPMREIDDWFLVFNRAQLMHIHNQVLDITNASSGRFRKFYKATMLAGGSLKTLRDNSNPKVYARIMKEINRKDSRTNTRKCLWPLACIYTIFEQEQ